MLEGVPAVGEAPDGSAVWLVGLDGTEIRGETSPLLRGLNEIAPPTDVPIPGPVRMASVALSGRAELRVDLAVVDDDNPLLAFGEDGVLLPSGLPLPGRPVWLLFPGVQNDLRINGGAAVVTDSPLPPGWLGWSLVLFDLDAASSVAVKDVGRPWLVRSHAAARVISAEPVRGVRTATGLPVISSLPTIELPEQLRGAAWTVSITEGSGNVWRGCPEVRRTSVAVR